MKSSSLKSNHSIQPVSPLSGLRVLDLCDEPGWLCGGLLRGLGAEVVLVQPPGQPVPSNPANLGKRHLSLNLSPARGREILLRLLEKADILVESFPAGELEEQGLGYATMRSANPALILASITPFGQSGPYRDFKTTELISSALGGQLWVTGEPGRPPLEPFGPLAYSAASLFAANAILLALSQRRKSGRGAHLDIAIHEAVAGTLDHLLPRFFATGEAAGRAGSLYSNGNFAIFKCRDGYVLLSLFYQWTTLVELLAAEGRAGELVNAEWLDETYRREHVRTVAQILQKWTSGQAVADLVELGQALRFPWAAVDDLEAVRDNPQLNTRGYFVEVPSPKSQGKVKIPGAPVKMSGSPWLVAKNWPKAGEDNPKIYGEELGLSAGERAALKRRGVI
jgi:crotonobetainyl-CoA:carnitine CoA-transferase CaiB-like acyl-CoA transferase